MRFAPIVSLAVVSVLLAGCGPGPNPSKEVLYRHHFAGLSAVAGHVELGRVREVLALPESQVVVSNATRKLAASMPSWFGGGALGTNDALIYQPLVRAMVDSESHLEVRLDGERISDWAVAVRLADPGALERAGVDLRRMLGAPSSGKATEPFEVAGGAGGVSARFATAGGWMVLGRGRGAFDAFTGNLLKLGSPVAAGAATNAAGAGILDLEADLRRLAALTGLREKPPGPLDQWPSLRLLVTPRNGQFRTTASLSYGADLGLGSEPWLVPTNVLRDPLVGFTAVRGAGTWLGRLGLFADLGVTEWPRQIFLWSMAGDPWLQYFSTPIQSPTNLMAQISLTLPVRAVTNMLWSEKIFSLRITNQARRVELRGLPYFAPFMEAQGADGNEQLFGGLFPHTAGGRPAPAGLIQQVTGRTNLVLYDWETTGRRFVVTNPPGLQGPPVVTNDIGRLIQFKHLAQFARLMLSKDPLRLPTASGGELLIPGSKWMDAALPLLRDTVTEVTRSGPRELSATRQSVTGFNSLELLYLLRWIENPGFPGWIDLAQESPRTRPEGAGQPPTPAVPGAAGSASSGPGMGKFPPPVKAPGTP